jgi:hypothetical protein
MAEPKSPSDRFHPGMPTIPGVGQRPGAPSGGAAVGLSARALRSLILLGAVLFVSAVAGFWIHSVHNRPKTHPGSQTDVHDVLQDADAPASLPLPVEAKPVRAGPGPIARLDELSKPWSSVAFTFTRADTQEEVPAMVVRLPGGAGSSGSYWAFSLVEPYGKCQLVYLTDAKKLASQFGFEAHHPMVADPCDGAVFDPLGMGARPDGKWIRGAIVQGGALRPPLAIEVSVHEDNLYADRIE